MDTIYSFRFEKPTSANTLVNFLIYFWQLIIVNNCQCHNYRIEIVYYVIFLYKCKLQKYIFPDFTHTGARR